MSIMDYDDLDIKLVVRKMSKGLILNDDDKLIVYNTNSGLVNFEMFVGLFKVIDKLKCQIDELRTKK